VYLLAGDERVFQQITEVFALRRLIGKYAEATVFQAAFCLLLYNMVQVMRGYMLRSTPTRVYARRGVAEHAFLRRANENSPRECSWCRRQCWWPRMRRSCRV